MSALESQLEKPLTAYTLVGGLFWGSLKDTSVKKNAENGDKVS